MKEFLKCVIILFVFGAIITLVGWKYLGWFDKSNLGLQKEIDEIKGYDVEIMTYGNIKPTKQITIEYTQLDSITDESLSKCNKAYCVIVLSDLDGQLQITDDELLLIKRYCEEKHYDFLFYGHTKVKQLQRCGFTYYDGMPFMYQGSIFRSQEAPEFNGTEWYDSATDTYYANPYWMDFNWDEQNTVTALQDSAIFWRSVVREVIATLNLTF